MLLMINLFIKPAYHVKNIIAFEGRVIFSPDQDIIVLSFILRIKYTKCGTRHSDHAVPLYAVSDFFADTDSIPVIRTLILFSEENNIVVSLVLSVMIDIQKIICFLKRVVWIHKYQNKAI